MDPEIEEVKQKISEVEQEIKDVEGLLTNAAPSDVAYLRKKEDRLRKKEEQLRKQEDRLRKKEDRLRKKEEQLREEKLLLLRADNSGMSMEKRGHELEALPDRKIRRKVAYTTSIPVEDEEAETLWKNVVKDRVPCSIVSVDNLLDPERPLVADLRYLELLHVGRTISVRDIVEMKNSRKAKEHDLERCYYGPALTIMQASVEGQQDVCVLSEDHTKGDGARGDLRLYVKGQECPSEMKASNGSANPLTDPTGIHNNKAAFGKLLKIIWSKFLNCDGGSQTFICTFLNRIECLWFVKFEFEGTELKTVEVAPEIPSKGNSPSAVICSRLDDIIDISAVDRVDTLADLLIRVDTLVDLEVPLGFKYMTRYIDTLCRIKDVPLTDVVFKMRSGDCIDMTGARIIARGRKSLILQVGDEDAVVKVGPRECIEVEISIHKVVDCHVQNIRYMVDGVAGPVEGAGKLSFIKLQGLGSFVSDISWDKLGEYWTSMARALSGLHARKVLHRDIKPENMLFIDKQLVLNDFDVSCSSHDSLKVLQYVGTASYRSFFWKKGEPFVPADDWVSLGRSFASLLQLPEGYDNWDCLVDHPRIPVDMREMLTAALKSAAARETGFLDSVRQGEMTSLVLQYCQSKATVHSIEPLNLNGTTHSES